MHNNLNPALWDKDGNLLPEVEDRIYKIVNKFQSECMLPLDIVDVHLVGSNASFNYNSQSDLDVHIIVNFDLLDVDKEILTAAYNLQKAQFNRDYDISIHGVNIEMYIEDINSMTASNGIYSLYNKKWIKKPVKKSYPTLDKRFYDTLDRLADKMRKVVSSDDEVEITKNINMLYMMRKNGLATDGEFSIGNLLFKEIRNLGLLDELKQRLKEVQSDRLTLEQMNSKYRKPSFVTFNLIKNAIINSCKNLKYNNEINIGYGSTNSCYRTLIPNLFALIRYGEVTDAEIVLGSTPSQQDKANPDWEQNQSISHCWITYDNGNKICQSNNIGSKEMRLAKKENELIKNEENNLFPIYTFKVDSTESDEQLCNEIVAWVQSIKPQDTPSNGVNKCS